MKVIYKYILPTGGKTIVINEPIAEVLSLQLQNGIPTMWAIIDTEIEEIVPLKIIAIGTGWTLDKGVDGYLGTIQDDCGYVWHYFKYEKDETTTIDLNKAFGEIEGLFDACM